MTTSDSNDVHEEDKMDAKEFAYMCQLYFQELCSTSVLGDLKLFADGCTEMNHFKLIEEKLRNAVYETIDQFHGDLQYLCLDIVENGTTTKYSIPSDPGATSIAQIPSVQTKIDMMYEHYMNTNEVGIAFNEVCALMQLFN